MQSINHILSLLLLSFSSRLGLVLPPQGKNSLPTAVWAHSHRRQSSKLLQHESVSGATVFHKQLHLDLLHSVPSFWNRLLCSGTLHRVTNPTSRPAPAWAPLSWGHWSCQETCCSADFLQAHRLLQSHPPVVGSSVCWRGTAASP